MKKKVFLSVAVMVTVFLISPAFAGEARERPGPRHFRPPQNAGFLVGRFFHDNMKAEVLSELTGLEENTFASLQGVRMGDILAQYHLEEKVFKAAMDAKTIALAKKAAACGFITTAQAAEIENQLKNRPKKPGPGELDDTRENTGKEGSI